MATKMGSLEGRLCGHLAAALSKFLAHRPPNETGEKGRPIRCSDVRISAQAERALAAIGVMDELPKENGQSWQAYVFNMDSDDMVGFLASSIVQGDSKTGQLVDAFICVACYDGSLSSERDWFQPPAQFQTSMQWLTRTGYAEQNEEKFRWTDDNKSWDTIWAAEREAEFNLMWETMPDTMRQAILSGRASLLDVVRWLALGWKDGTWQHFRNDGRITLSGNKTVWAMEIIDRVKSGVWK